MQDLEFFYKQTDLPLPFKPEEDVYTTQQYRGGWYVRMADVHFAPPHLLVGDKYLPLKRYESDDCFEVSDAQMVAQIKAATGGEIETGLAAYVGQIQLWSLADPNVPKKLHPALSVEPGNIAPQEFDAIIERLRELAIFQHSPVQVKVKGSVDVADEGASMHPDDQLLRASQSLYFLIQQVLLNWDLIKKFASKETQLVPRLVNASSLRGSVSSRIIQKASQKPDARRFEVLVPHETHITVENKFLAFVLQEIGRQAPVFIGKLNARAQQLRYEWSKDSNPESTARRSSLSQQKHYRENFGEKWREGQEKSLCLATEMEALAGKIGLTTDQVLPRINEPFLQEVRNVPALPLRPTDHLTQSVAYSPIYKSFYEYYNITKPSFISLKSGLMQGLENKSIHAASTLYEFWVLIEIYDMLVTKFGFRPPVDAENDHPLQRINVVAGDIVRSELTNHEFRLEFQPSNNNERKISLRLFYDTEQDVPSCVPDKRCYDADICHSLRCYDKIMRLRRSYSPPEFHWSKLRPDLIIEIKDSASDTEQRFAVDAKYRRYPGAYYSQERQYFDVDSVFDLDLLITSKMKYRDALGCCAAFVIHSDVRRDYTYWGDKPWETPPHREKALNTKQHPKYDGPGHHYGAVFALPSDTTNIERLLKCFLMYHMGIENVCWHCQQEVEHQDDVKCSFKVYTPQYDEFGHMYGTDIIVEDKRPVGRCYQCPDCQRFWVRTWCANRKQGGHPLLKLGSDNFHQRSQLGLIICPICGDGSVDKNVKT